MPAAPRSDDADPRPPHGGAADYRGRVRPGYAPRADHAPDPGEVVWTWVPYEEDHGLGKDRPVLIIGTALDRPGDLAALLLSSRDRDGDRRWVAVGSGGWDPQRRPSWARLDRPLAVSPRAVRRVGAVLDMDRYDAVLAAAAALQAVVPAGPAQPRVPLLRRVGGAVRRLLRPRR